MHCVFVLDGRTMCILVLVSLQEYHLDLRCWMAIASGVMHKLATVYGTEAEKTKYLSLLCLSLSLVEVHLVFFLFDTYDELFPSPTVNFRFATYLQVDTDFEDLVKRHWSDESRVRFLSASSLGRSANSVFIAVLSNVFV